MKKYIKYLSISVIACVALTLSSCKDFLYPTSYNNLTSDSFYQTDAQITAALTSVYTVLRTSAHGATYFTNVKVVLMRSITTTTMQTVQIVTL